jgi:hypothetical protein
VLTIILVRECHQSLVKLAEHNRIQLVWVPGHMGIAGNEIADQLARQGSSHPLTGPEPALAYLERLPEECSGSGQLRNTRSIGSPFADKGKLQTFLEDCELKEVGKYSA